MKRKSVWLLMSCLLVLVMVLASCQQTTTVTTQTGTSVTGTATLPTSTTTTTTSPPTTPPTTAPSDKPQYGGTITVAGGDPLYWDGWFGNVGDIGSFWWDRMGIGDWAIDRSIFNFKLPSLAMKFATGALAESYEAPDAETIIFRLRKGVRWQNKDPMNGRELVADDFVYAWERFKGFGRGTKRSPLYTAASDEILSITASDKYTVLVKTKPSLSWLPTMYIDQGLGYGAYEAIQKWGDVNDWKRVQGTGPFIVVDYVSGASMLMKKNTNYWGYDERNPKNSIPYVDQVKFLNIPDYSTALAALRAGKLDDLSMGSANPLLSWQQAESLRQTNPEMQLATRSFAGWGVGMRIDKAPFSDIRVRAALQMAIDLPTIAKTYYGGNVAPIPYPMFIPADPDTATPFDQLPANVKAEYTYNPAGAKELLKAAGYPNGFSTNLIIQPQSQDMDLAQICKSYWADIGVIVEIKPMEVAPYWGVMLTLTPDAMGWDWTAVATGSTVGDLGRFRLFAMSPKYSTRDWWHRNDTVIDDLLTRAYTSLDVTERASLIKQALDRFTAQHYLVSLLPVVRFAAWQPWLKGYSGELCLGVHNVAPVYARLWVDQGLKKSMGK